MKNIRAVFAYAHILGNQPGNRIGIIKYRESGYYLTTFDHPEFDKDQVDNAVSILNREFGIPSEVAESMRAASMFGWNIPAAREATNWAHLQAMKDSQ